MAQPTAAKCFEPFFSTKPVDKGTGLGLSTAYGAVRKHRGEITELGRGTTFTLYFPLAFREPKNEPPTLAPARPPSGTKVLVVDDEVEICRLIQKLLNTPAT